MQESPSQQIMSKLEKLAKNLAPLDNSRFVELSYKGPDGKKHTIYVYPEPLKTTDGPVVADLNFPEQLVFYRLAADQLGIELHHPSFRETVESFRAGGEFKKKVLAPCWIYTGEIAQQTKKGADTRTALGAKFVDAEYRKSEKTSSAVLVQNGKPLSGKDSEDEVEKIFQVQYEVSDILQTSIATGKGTFKEFKSAVPVDSEITGEGDLCWYGVSFENDLTAVRAGTYFGVQVFSADAGRLLYGDSNGVLSTVLRAKPEK